MEVTYSVYRTAEMLPDKDIKLSMTVENGKIPTDMANKVDTVFGELETKYTADLGLTSTMAIHNAFVRNREWNYWY